MSEVDAAGHVVRIYTGQPELVFPTHMAWYGSQLLLVDWMNLSILLLTADLKLDRVLLTDELDELGVPFRLSYNNNNRRLAIQTDDSRIKLYQLWPHL